MLVSSFSFYHIICNLHYFSYCVNFFDSNCSFCVKSSTIGEVTKRDINFFINEKVDVWRFIHCLYWWVDVFHCHQISTNHVLIQSAQDILCTDLAENITINQISILKRNVKSSLIFQIILVNNFSECQL